MKEKKIALTGGIATGKSTVAAMFEGLGALILDADRVAREVVQPGKSCWIKLSDLLGPAYFDPQGDLDRRKLRERIIQDAACRLEVNAILHPAILSEMDGQWKKRMSSDSDSVVIFDIPLLFELDLDRRFGTIILVYTTREIQIQRLVNRDGLTRSEAENTLSMQLPIDSKRAGSHIIIDNSLDLDHTRQQVTAAWEKLRPKPDLS